jgi:predicted aminopeptidase
MGALKEKLAFVASLREYGKEHMTLQFDGSFEHYSDEHQTCNWLYVCYPDKLVSGLKNRAPFEFHWDTAKAKRRQKHFEKKGFHTYLYQAEAHGGHHCPITPSLLESDKARQGYVVLHEGWHATLRLEGLRMPYTLEESTGRVVGLEGAKQYARHTGDTELLQTASDQMDAWGVFAGYINTMWRKLSKLYAQPKTERELNAIMQHVRDAAEAIRLRMPPSWEREELNRPVTNAFILRNHDYTWYYPLALDVLKKTASLKRAMLKYRKAADEGAPGMLKEYIKKR